MEKYINMELEKLDQDSNNKNLYRKVVIIGEEMKLMDMIKVYVEEFFKKFQCVQILTSLVNMEVLSKEFPDLIIVDERYPGQCGLNLLKDIRRANNMVINHTPVLLLSIANDPHMVKSAIKKGAEGYLLKPFLKSELVNRIKKLVD